MQFYKNIITLWITIFFHFDLTDCKTILILTNTLVLIDFCEVFPFNSHYDSVEKAVATHCSTLAWKIPWMEEPGRLPPMGLHRVGHDWSNLAAAAWLCELGTKNAFPSGWRNLFAEDCWDIWPFNKILLPNIFSIARKIK